MRHNSKVHSFNRKAGPRKALIRGLVDSLVEHGRNKTTLTKAKVLRSQVERAITIGKAQTVHARRLLLSQYPNPKTVSGIVDNLSKRFKDRPGGYTRILKLGSRPGDMADMAFIEFVDYELPKAAGEETVKGDKEAVKRAKAAARRAIKKKKKIRKIQAASRRINRRQK